MMCDEYDQNIRKASDIVSDIRTGRISSVQAELIISKIAELHPEVLIEARNRIPEIEDAILDFLRKDQKIYAIKFYRQAAGVGLREAKNAVDKIEKSWRESNANL